MRIASLAFAVMLCACETAPTASTGPAPDPALAMAELAEAKALPDFRPESANACNAVRLDVSLSATGALSINGAPTDMDGLKAAAQRKNAACLNAPAMVLLDTQPGAPAAMRQAVLDTLSGAIVNLGVIETTS